MEGFISKIEKHLVPLAGKLNGQRHLAALRDGFVAIMPLIIIGAFAVMINSVFLNWADGSLIAAFMENPVSADDIVYPSFVVFLQNLMNFIVQGSLSIIGVIAIATIAYSLTKIKGHEGLEAVVIALGVYFISIESIEGAYAGGFFGTANIITAILLAMFVAEVYTFCIKKSWTIKMPEGVPPAVGRSFAALIPALIIVTTVAFVQTLTMNLNIVPTFDYSNGAADLIWTTGSLSIFIQNAIGLPLHAVAGGLGGLLFYSTGGSFLWFFGIHGPNTLAFLDQAIFTPAAIQNATLIAQGVVDYSGNILDQAAYAQLQGAQLPSMYSKSMLDAFVFIGGSGTTIGLIAAIFIGSRDKASRQVAKYSLGPALFNINEPLLFGLPIVFNPLLFIPFIIVQPIIIILTVILMQIGLLPIYAITIPWTSPVGIGAFLAYGGSIIAMLWAFGCVAISTAIYYPFVVAMNRSKAKEEAGQEA